MTSAAVAAEQQPGYTARTDMPGTSCEGPPPPFDSKCCATPRALTIALRIQVHCVTAQQLVHRRSVPFICKARTQHAQPAQLARSLHLRLAAVSRCPRQPHLPLLSTSPAASMSAVHPSTSWEE